MRKREGRTGERQREGRREEGGRRRKGKGGRKKNGLELFTSVTRMITG